MGRKEQGGLEEGDREKEVKEGRGRRKGRGRWEKGTGIGKVSVCLDNVVKRHVPKLFRCKEL